MNLTSARLLRTYRALPRAARIAVPAVGGAAALLLLSGTAAAAAGPDLDEGAVAGPAYPWLQAWTPEERQTLVDVARRLNLNPRALASVFQLETGGDHRAPHKKEGTPRGGLNQITVGAKLPGFDTAEKVWAVREWPIIDQLLGVVEPFFARYKGRDLTWDEFTLYKKNFLPGVAGRGDDFVIAVKGSSELLIPGQKKPTLGSIYEANPGFDAGKKGYFTWGDVHEKVRKARRAGGDNVVTVGGAVIPDPQRNQRRIPPRRTPGRLWPVPRWLEAPEDMAVRPRLEAWS